MRKLLIFYIMVASAAVAVADTISNCPSCQGGTYTLTYTWIGGDTYDLTYTIDTSGYNGGGVAINSVAIKSASAILSFSLTEAPGGVALWTTQGGQLNANGCSGSGSGWVCSQSTGLGVAVPTTDQLTWRWQIATTSLFTGIDEASVKALFVDAVGEKIGNILSNRITDTPGGDPPGVPEPSTNTLITIACAGGVLLFLNRRENKKQ